MRVWIDLANSPHPLLFAPIARRLEHLGHAVLITARDNAQTVDLARERWPEAVVIGGASPAGRPAKAMAIAARARELRRWARRSRPDVALSHNSYGQIVAARLLGVPVVTTMDFEYQPANHLAFRLARTILLPRALEDSDVARQGASARKTRFYAGLKEELYLSDFRPEPRVLERLGIASGPATKLVVARPAPDQAAYHAFKNPLFLDAVRVLLRDPGVVCVVLPRHAEQRRAVESLRLERCVVPARAIDFRSLLVHANLMVGAGGTMTREAALMGVPTLSLYAGAQPAVDRWLEERGLMRLLRRVDDLPTVEPRPAGDRLASLRERGRGLVASFCDAVTASA